MKVILVDLVLIHLVWISIGSLHNLLLVIYKKKYIYIYIYITLFLWKNQKQIWNSLKRVKINKIIQYKNNDENNQMMLKNM